MKTEKLFSSEELEAIREATSAAETQTGGEIVPYIVERVFESDHARWRGATLGALAAALAAGFSESRGDYVATMDADLQDDPAEIPTSSPGRTRRWRRWTPTSCGR